MKWYLEVLRQYAVFTGRARRQEYWMFVLINMIISVALSVLSFGILETLYALAVFIPSMAVSVRRLHDTGRSGWWLLVGLVPFIGILVLIYFFVLDSQPGSNQYGPNPKMGEPRWERDDDDDDEIEVEAWDDDDDDGPVSERDGGSRSAAAAAGAAVTGALVAGSLAATGSGGERQEESALDDDGSGGDDLSDDLDDKFDDCDSGGCDD